MSAVLVGHSSTANYRVLYNFGKSGTDANTPRASLVEVNGILYGTTQFGGKYGGSYGGGTVFRISLNGSSERVVHSFGYGSDGCQPTSALIELNGTLYGTTSGGGSYDSAGTSSGYGGIAFSMSQTGREHILHSFGYGSDGSTPNAAVMVVKGMTYGTTEGGGDKGNYHPGGTVFSLATDRSESVMHSFGKVSDGSSPESSLIYVNGTLYGTTLFGGKYGMGTVFSVSMAGSERILHSFKGLDGGFPSASLLYVNGKLYGTAGGGKRNGKLVPGTIFSMSIDGAAFRVLHSFGKRPDGSEPQASLIDVRGMLYGTTLSGGEYCNCGTVFRLSTTGRGYKVLHSFGKGYDGWGAGSSLIAVGRTLYGTTESGGTNTSGTIFALTP
jgi:uncharacterized repeat protein (TIGR03803 family)